MEFDSILNSNFEEVLDIISKPFKNNKDVVGSSNKVAKLLFDLDLQNLPSKLFDGFMIYWNSLPEEMMDFSTVEKLNLRINQFSRYILGVEDQLKDHGYSLIAIYYLYICREYLGGLLHE